MASKTLSNSSTKSLVKLLTIFAILFSLSNSALAGGHGEAAPAEGGGHGGGGGGHEAKPKKKEGNFSAKELDAMKQSQLLTYLSNANVQSSEYAIFYFEQKGEAGVSPLLRYMKEHDDNEKIVSSVIYTLGRVGKKASRAVPVLTKYLSYQSMDIRNTTIASLGKIGKASDPAVPIIAEYLEADDEWTRNIALRSLKDIGTPQAKAIAQQYDKKLQLQEERRKAELLGNKIEPEKEEVKEEKKESKDEKAEEKKDN